MELYALKEGSYSVDSSKKFIPFDPLIHKTSDRPGSLFIHVNPFLLKTPNELLVIDTGLGFNNEQGNLIIHENIRAAGFVPEDVTKVLMSHLHYDHSGGMVWNKNGQLEPSFPNAEYIINRNEWETAFSKDSSSYRTQIFDIIQRSGQIVFVEGSGKLTDEISYELTGGHCEFHQVFHIESESKHYFYGGDILPEPEQLQRNFIAKYDFDGRLARDLRTEYGKQAVSNDWICLFYHSKGITSGKVSGNEHDGFQITEV
ncbi:MBL fold metallo-hydrolase [Pseudopedobacter beijingensis]|uniref:MBL fold metallo-hydrolase n=1 Tax=Pseudopedobacter beijingensis TaxID=1207056 RepID=A0ABW4I757_9SPHI